MIEKYKLNQEKGHLLVTIEAGRILYRDDLLTQEKNGQLARLLVQEELRFARIAPLDDRAKRHPFHHIHIRPSEAFEAVKLLALTTRLWWKNQRLFLDPFTLVDPSWEAELQEHGKLLLQFVPKMEWGFAGDPGFGIFEGIIRQFARQIDQKWLDFPTILEGVEKEQFIDRFREGERPRAPYVVWKTTSAIHPPDPKPILVLKDRTGGFADLWVDYEQGRQVAFHDPQKFSWRNPSEEKGLEKDLLETNFTSKIVSDAHYYCPLDRVAESLKFLLELGWQVKTKEGERVILQTESDWTLSVKEEFVLIKGRIQFGEHAASAEQVLQSARKQEPFIHLGPDAVGLLDRRRLPSDLESTEELEIVQEGVRLHQTRLGLIDRLVQDGSIYKEPSFLALYEHVPLPLGVFQGELHPYQQRGVDWLQTLYAKGWHGLLADEMGLGKTVQVLAFLSSFQKKGAVLVVVPTSLVFHWRKEIERFLPTETLYIHSGTSRRALFPQEGIIVTSYALLRLDKNLFSETTFGCVILDEAQHIKNSTTQTAEAACALKAHFRLILTGTPVENRIEDLCSLFHFLMPGLIKEGDLSLSKKVRPFILRRKKEEVALELPPKIEQTIWVEMGNAQREWYDQWIAKSKAGLLSKVSLDGVSKHRMEILETILRLRQICCHPHLVPGAPFLESAKLERMLEDLLPLVAEKRKVLIYSQFTSMIRLMEKEIAQRQWPYLRLDGETVNREEVVTAFQENKEIPLFLISLKAGGVGLNLQAADYVFLFDPWWNLAVENQAIDRAHRLGRKGTLIARRYITSDSIEEKIMELKEKKRAISDQFLEPSDSTSLEELFDCLL